MYAGKKPSGKLSSFASKAVTDKWRNTLHFQSPTYWKRTSLINSVFRGKKFTMLKKTANSQKLNSGGNLHFDFKEIAYVYRSGNRLKRLQAGNKQKVWGRQFPGIIDCVDDGDATTCVNYDNAILKFIRCLVRGKLKESRHSFKN